MPEQEYLTVEHLSLKEITRLFSGIIVTERGCWEWIPARPNKYPRIHFRGAPESVHRIMYAWAVGPIPKGQGRDIPNLDHFVCDNPPCCNPAHLKLGPQRDNVLRGNSAQGQNARKTHCRRGHELPPTRYFVNARPCRICTICAAESQQKRRDAKRKTPYRPRPKIKGNQHARRVPPSL